MPTYDYECRSCGHTFELFQNIKENPLKKCPSCSQDSLARLIGSGAGIIFKGSGFYCTDYRKSDGAAGANKGGADASDATAKKETKSSDGTAAVAGNSAGAA